MNSSVATLEKREVVRPLKVLVPLIKEEIAAGDQAGEHHYTKAGELLNEARDGHFKGKTEAFWQWGDREFQKSRNQLRTWMAFATANSAKSFENLEQFRRAPKTEGGLGHSTSARSSGRLHREWTAPVDAVAERARQEAFRLAQEDALTRAQEREAERKLSHRLIDIGYKVLAKELHPDKMRGDRDAMARLNRVRDKLKHSI